MTDLDTLIRSHCQPRKGASDRLDADAVGQRLALLPEWELIDDGKAISRRFGFKDYYRTLAYVNALGFMAHREDHHPDLGVHYDRVVVRYSTHDVDGLSENDFICAARADALYGSAAQPGH